MAEAADNAVLAPVDCVLQRPQVADRGVGEGNRGRRFELLDGLRGVAALAVVMFHFGERGALTMLSPHGYLAADFFFVLSGFVLAHVYMPRLRAGLGMGAFITARLIRLLPMLLPGTLIGAALEFGRPGAVSVWRHLGETCLAAVLGVVMIPLPFATSLEHVIFPLNGPVWSLFFEMIANIAFVALVTRGRPVAYVCSLALISGLAFIAVAEANGDANLGFWIGNWAYGTPRVLFSFFAGILLHARPIQMRRLPVWIFPIILAGILFTPHLDGQLGVIFDLVVIFICFPLLVAAASASEPPRLPRWMGSLPGRLSYPVYAIHYPVVRGVTFLLNRHGAHGPARVAAAMLTVVGVCCLGYVLLRCYDEPARRVLGRWQARQNSSLLKKKSMDFCFAAAAYLGRVCRRTRALSDHVA